MAPIAHYFQQLATCIYENCVDDFKQLLGADDEERKSNALHPFNNTEIPSEPVKNYNRYTTILQLAALYCRADIIKYLFDIGLSPIDQINPYGHSALTILVEKPDSTLKKRQEWPKSVQHCLLHKSVDVHAVTLAMTDGGKWSPLGYAASMSGGHEILKQMLKRTDLNINLDPGITPLIVALKVPLNTRLILRHKDVNVNHFAKTGGPAIVSVVMPQPTATLLSARQLLAHKDIRVDQMNGRGETAVMKAVNLRHHIMHALLLHGRI